MQNFEFLSPTKIIFGKGTENKVGREMKKLGEKVLLHYGGGSIKKSGLYDIIAASLKSEGLEFVELGGVMPNPRLSHVNEGIKFCREQKIDCILAVGGGSVFDSAKTIALGVPYAGDVWDFYDGKAVPKEALPLGVVLTIPASGSEASQSSVVTNENGGLKRGFNTLFNRPTFAIMNPELTFTLPPYQTACGVSDIMAHLMERYFTRVPDVDLTDRLSEAALQTVIANGPVVLEKPDDYAARAEIMWAGTLAHNDLLGTGRVGDFASHWIEHELSAINDVAHGAGLSIIFPAWMKYVYMQGLDRFVQFAVRVWNVGQNFEHPERTALEGIERMKGFFVKMGLPVSLKEIGITPKDFDLIADKCKKSPEGAAGNFVKLYREDIINILKLAE